MSYAQLVADLELNSRKFEQGLQWADNAMRTFTRTQWMVPLSLDTKGFGQQLSEVKSALRSIGNLSVPVDLDLRVNGKQVAAEMLTGIDKQLDQTSAKISVVHKNLEELSSGQTAVKFDTSQVMQGLEQINAGILRYKKEFSSGAGFGDIKSQINELEKFFAGQGIKADGFNRVIPELQKVLEMQEKIQGRRSLDLDIKVSESGVATISKLDVQINGLQKELSQAFTQLESGGKAAILPMLRGIEDLDARLAAAREHLEELSASGKGAVRLDSLNAENLALKEQARIEKAALSLFDERAKQAEKFAEALQKVSLRGAVDSAREVSALLDKAASKAAAMDRRSLADDLRDQGVFASVIGGEKGINSDLFKAAQKAGLPTATQEMGTPMGMNAAAIRQAIAELEAFDEKAKQTALDSKDIGKAMDANARTTIKATADMSRTIDGVLRTIKQTATEEDKAAKKMTVWGEATGGIVGQMKALGNTITRWVIGYAAVSQMIKGFDALKFATLDYNSLLQKSQITFTTLMDGNSQRAKAFLGTLREYARISPWEFKDLIPFTQKLITLGLVSQNEIEKKAVPAIDAISNAVAALGGGPELIDRIVLALGQMTQKGKASSEEVTRQLGEAGINGAKYIADAMHKTIPQVFDLMKKGAIDGKQAALAVLDGMANDPKFKGMNEKLSRTFEGAFSNIKDALNDIVGGATSEEFGVLSQKMVQFADVLNSPAFQQKAVAGIGMVTEGLLKLGEAAIWLGTEAIDKLPYLVTILTVLGSTKIVNGIRALGASMVLAFGEATLPILAVTAGVVGLIAAYRKFPIVQEITEDTIGVTLVFFKEFSYGLTNVVSWIGQAVGKVGEMLGWLKKVPAGVTNAMNLTLPGSGILTQWLGSISDTMVNVGTSAAGLPKASDKFWDGLLNGFLNTGSKKMKQFLTSDFSNLFNMDGLMNSLMGKAKKGLADYSNLFKPGNLFNNNANPAKGMREQATELDRIAQGYEKAAKAAEDSGKRQLDALKSVRDVLRDVLGGMQEALAKFGVFNSPLDAAITRIEKLANIGPRAAEVARVTLATSGKFRDEAKGLRDQAATLRQKAGAASTDGSGTDGLPVIPDGVGAKSGLGDRIAAAAVKMQATAASYVHHCDQLADTTVRTVTNAFNAIMGPRSGDTAAKTMARFMAAGIGFKPNGSFQAGDIVYSSSRVGKGAGHVQIIGPDGEFYDQYGHHVKPTTRPDWVVRPGGRSVASHVGTFIKNPMGVGNQAALEPGGDDAQGFAQNVIGLLSDLKISKFMDLPKAWGSTIKDSEENANRFAVQMLLANRNTQMLLRTALGDKGFAALTKELRETAFEADKTTAKLKATAQIETDIRQGTLDAARRAAVGNKGDVFGRFYDLQRQSVKNGQFQVPVFDYVKRYEQLQKELSDAIDLQTKNLQISIRDARRVRSAQNPFLMSGDTYGAERAGTLQQQAIEFSRTPEMLALWNTNRAGFNRRMDERKNLDATQYDEGKARDRADAIRSLRREYDLTNQSLTAQLGIVSKSTLGETALSDALAKQETILQKTKEFRDMGFLQDRAKTLANEMAAREQNNRVLEREIELRKTLASSAKDAQDAVDLSQRQVAIYGSMSGNNPRLQLELAHAAKVVELMRQNQEGKIDAGGVANLIADFDKSQQAGYVSSRAAESNSRLAQVQNDLTEKRLELTRGLSEVQKQLLQWQIQGEAVSDEERQNREKTLNVLKQIDALKPLEWRQQTGQGLALSNPLLNDKTMGDLQFQMNNPSWNASQIEENLPIDRMFRKLKESQDIMRGVLDDWRSSWNQTWDDMASKGQLSLNTMLDNMTARLVKFGTDFLASKTWDLLLGLLGNSAAGLFGGRQTTVQDGINQGWINPGQVAGPPVQTNSANVAAAIARGNAAAVGRSLGVASVGAGDIHIHGDVILPSVTRKSEFASGMKAHVEGARDSRRTTAKRSQQFVSTGA